LPAIGAVFEAPAAAKYRVLPGGGSALRGGNTARLTACNESFADVLTRPARPRGL